MNFILRLKHWQFFILISGAPFIMNLIFTISNFVFKYSSFLFIVFTIVTLISVASVLVWYYALGTNLHEKLPETIRMNVVSFKIHMLIIACYCIFFFYLLINARKNRLLGQSIDHNTFQYLLPFHFLSMILILYCLYFIAKAFKAVQLQRPVSINDFAGEFFQLLFYPIGIWLIQPKINKLFTRAKNLNNKSI